MFSRLWNIQLVSYKRIKIHKLLQFVCTGTYTVKSASCMCTSATLTMQSKLWVVWWHYCLCLYCCINMSQYGVLDMCERFIYIYVNLQCMIYKVFFQDIHVRSFPSYLNYSTNAVYSPITMTHVRKWTTSKDFLYTVIENDECSFKT
jgi:hypothetical protein